MFVFVFMFELVVVVMEVGGRLSTLQCVSKHAPTYIRGPTKKRRSQNRTRTRPGVVGVNQAQKKNKDILSKFVCGVKAEH